MCFPTLGSGLSPCDFLMYSEVGRVVRQKAARNGGAGQWVPTDSPSPGPVFTTCELLESPGSSSQDKAIHQHGLRLGNHRSSAVLRGLHLLTVGQTGHGWKDWSRLNFPVAEDNVLTT